MGEAILISDIADFKPQRVIRDKDEYYITINRPCIQKDVTTLNVYVSKTSIKRIESSIKNGKVQ